MPPGVVEGAVQHGVEPTGVLRQVGGVGDGPLDVQPGGPHPGLLDGGGRGVDGGHLVAEAGQVDRVVAEAAADVEDLAAEPAELVEVDDRGLLGLDVPRHPGDAGALDELAAEVDGVEVGAGEVVLRAGHGQLLVVAGYWTSSTSSPAGRLA
jgi:hypothetical protein